MGKAVIASIIGLLLELVCESHHARGRQSINSMKVVSPASLKDKINGVYSIDSSISSTLESF